MSLWSSGRMSASQAEDASSILVKGSGLPKSFIRVNTFLLLAILLSFAVSPIRAQAAPPSIRLSIAKAVTETNNIISNSSLSVNYKSEKLSSKGRVSSYLDFSKDNLGNFRYLTYGSAQIAKERVFLGNYSYQAGSIASIEDDWLAAVRDLGLGEDFSTIKEPLSTLEKSSKLRSSLSNIFANNLYLADPFLNLETSRSTIAVNKIGKIYSLVFDLDKRCSTCKFYSSKNRALVTRVYKINNAGIITEIAQSANKFALEEYGYKENTLTYNIKFVYNAKISINPPTSKMLELEKLVESKEFAKVYYNKKIASLLNTLVEGIRFNIITNPGLDIFQELTKLIDLERENGFTFKVLGNYMQIEFTSADLKGEMLYFCLGKVSLTGKDLITTGICPSI
jgi:hypothetical protein